MTHLERPFLHAARLAFEHPVTGETVEDFSLPTAGTIDAQVLDPSKQPVASALVCLSQSISEPDSQTAQGTPVAYFGRCNISI